MKKPSATLFAVFTIVTISGVTSTEYSKVCKNFNEECISDLDCCGNICGRSYNFKKYCRDLPLMSVLMSKMSMDPPAVELNCMFREPLSESAENELMRDIGPNAAFLDHSKLKPGTYVKITMNNVTVDLTINNRYPDTPNVLELSPTAAKMLGMKNYNTTDRCKIVVPYWPNHPTLRRFLMFIPVSGVIYVLYLFNQYNLY